MLSAPNTHTGRSESATVMEVEPILLAEPDPSSADSLVSSNDPDDLANEQTWPTEEEMQDTNRNVEAEVPDAVEGTTPKRIRRIPKGMSEYQAAWIVEDDDGEEEEGDEKEDTKDIDAEMVPLQEEEEMQDLPMDDAPTDPDIREDAQFQDLDVEEEKKQ